MNTQHLSLDQMKDSMRVPWIAGDFGAIAREIGAPEAKRLVARIELEPGARVLDIACGTGNVTIPLARRGALVTGLDMTPHLLEEARARPAREELRIRFDEGFAKTLPYPDGSFDMLVSMFGIMFSPLPETVAAEMARVLRPGGRLVLASRTPSGFTGKMSAVGGQHLPPLPQRTMRMSLSIRATPSSPARQSFNKDVEGLWAFRAIVACHHDARVRALACRMPVTAVLPSGCGVNWPMSSQLRHPPINLGSRYVDCRALRPEPRPRAAVHALGSIRDRSSDCSPWVDVSIPHSLTTAVRARRRPP